MKLSSAFVSLALALGVNAAGEWQQCAGKSFPSEACTSGLACVFINDFYSQCQKGIASSTVAPPVTSSAKTPVTITTSGPSPTVSTAPAPTGFVKTSGQRFILNGKNYPLTGSNSYWVTQGLSEADQNKAFADIAASGGATIRTWGFAETLSTTEHATYYQIWNGATPTINTGATGLQAFDSTVKAAKANGIRLIVALTNNWSDYGGMDVYVKQILGSANHDLFYTDAKVVAAFKNYIKTFVGRYANDPTILAWELANEPRCKGSSGTTSGTCNPATITAWAKDISAYIKSIDKNHLVALGDEGFYNQPNGPNYPYQGGEGIDFDANLKIATLDFGTFHAYPEHWGQTASARTWLTQWILDHAASQKAANKPVILEEFGLTKPAFPSRAEDYSIWYKTIESSGLTGDLYWQAGSVLSWGSTHDDGYAIFPSDPVYAAATAHNAAIKARA